MSIKEKTFFELETIEERQAFLDYFTKKAKRTMTHEQIEKTFSYHEPFGTQVMRYKQIRDNAKNLAHIIQDECPESREKSLALTNLQQTVMWANASIALNETDHSIKVQVTDDFKRE